MNKKIALLQMFRGVAAIAVLLHHTTGQALKVESYSYLNNLFNLGWAGVDFFFVLSGFIICYVHYRDVGDKSKLINFCLKRFIRLFPIYWVVSAGILLIYFLNPSFGLGHERNLATIIKSLFLIPQFPGHIVGVAWSLSHELLFYIIFAASITLPLKISAPIVSVWLLMVILYSLKIVVVSDNLYFSFLFSSYNLEFIFGCLSAYFVLNHPVKCPTIALMFGLSVLALTLYGLSVGMIHRSNIDSTVMFGISGALIITAAASFNVSQSNIATQWGGKVGDASYSIYLTHFYIIIFLFKLRSFVPINNFVYTTFVILLTLLLGMILYKYIEMPMLRYLNFRLISNNDRNSFTTLMSKK